jgi:hypothetical protein
LGSQRTNRNIPPLCDLTAEFALLSFILAVILHHHLTMFNGQAADARLQTVKAFFKFVLIIASPEENHAPCFGTSVSSKAVQAM